MVDDWILVADMGRGLLRSEWLAGDDSGYGLGGGEGSGLGAEELGILLLASACVYAFEHAAELSYNISLSPESGSRYVSPPRGRQLRSELVAPLGAPMLLMETSLTWRAAAKRRILSALMSGREYRGGGDVFDVQDGHEDAPESMKSTPGPGQSSRHSYEANLN